MAERDRRAEPRKPRVNSLLTWVFAASMLMAAAILAAAAYWAYGRLKPDSLFAPASISRAYYRPPSSQPPPSPQTA